MTHHCPIPNCPFPVPSPFRLCKTHYRLVPRPQQDALASYARSHKYGPAHQASFERAVETVTKLIAGRIPTRDQAAPAPAERWWQE